MSARPNLSSIPAAGITVDGIVDVLGGKSIVVARKVSAGNTVLKGQLVEVDGAGKVKTAAQNTAKANIAGVAVSSAVAGEVVSVLRLGIARLVAAADAGIAVGDNLSSFGTGLVTKTGANGVDGATATTAVIGEAADVGAGYVDAEINFLGAAV